jgi:predicted nucleic acid-binding protein
MSQRLVVDARCALQLILPGVHTAHVQAMLSDWQQRGCRLCAPTLWTYEMASTLCKAVYFRTLTDVEGRRALSLVHRLDVDLYPPDGVQTERAYDWTSRLQRASAYDSFYLALAETLGCELWTADRRLYQAVGLPWVRWAGAPGDSG